MKDNQKKLIIIDSNSVIYRAYHALPALTDKQGELINALYGFLMVFLKILKEFQPDYLAAAFDFPAPTFRHKKFKDYKANRPAAPDDLVKQIVRAKQALQSIGAVVFEKKGFEADDIIGTIARLSSLENIIVSGDSDILQLVNSTTRVYFLEKGVKQADLYGEQAVKNKFKGLLPLQLVDFKALKGDASDNIPGVGGIGEKTGRDLIIRLGSLDNLYQLLRQGEEPAGRVPPRLKELLLKQKKQAFLSKDLLKINQAVPLDFEINRCQWSEQNKEKTVAFLKDIGFLSLAGQLEKSAGREKKLIENNLKLW